VGASNDRADVVLSRASNVLTRDRSCCTARVR